MSDHESLTTLANAHPFSERHIGPDSPARAAMLAALGFDSFEALMSAAMPDSIRTKTALALPPAGSEESVARRLRHLAGLNTPREPMIGLGYHGTLTPPVVRRNVLEDPSWYTAYTPYQPEISQGRLEA
ncbi:MAG: glycine dehydrogenase (aminomethyl-transferring), partial [Nocardioidaceae bacterium]